MTRVYLLVSGRMGNHMFQYWVARWLSDHLGGWPIHYWCCDYGNYMPQCIPNIQYIEDHEHVRAARDHPGNIVRYTDSDMEQLCDLPGIVTRHRESQRPILIQAYLENYSILCGYETYIRNLYHIPGVQRRNIMALHIRLGDISHKNSPAIPAYQRYILACCARYGLPIEVYTDDLRNPLVHAIIISIQKTTGLEVRVSGTQSHNPSLDLVLMAGVSAIVMMNSTFSWWAGFLNQNRARVHVALSECLGNSFRRDSLFLPDTHNGWELYDLDTETVIRPLENTLSARPI